MPISSVPMLGHTVVTLRRSNMLPDEALARLDLGWARPDAWGYCSSKASMLQTGSPPATTGQSTYFAVSHLSFSLRKLSNHIYKAIICFLESLNLTHNLTYAQQSHFHLQTHQHIRRIYSGLIGPSTNGIKVADSSHPFQHHMHISQSDSSSDHRKIHSNYVQSTENVHTRSNRIKYLFIANCTLVIKPFITLSFRLSFHLVCHRAYTLSFASFAIPSTFFPLNSSSFTNTLSHILHPFSITLLKPILKHCRSKCIALITTCIAAMETVFQTYELTNDTVPWPLCILSLV